MDGVAEMARQGRWRRVAVRRGGDAWPDSLGAARGPTAWGRRAGLAFHGDGGRRGGARGRRRRGGARWWRRAVEIESERREEERKMTSVLFSGFAECQIAGTQKRIF
jgi:hypothetical protein